jgi:alkylated DNA nucleotide flippase Atl1
VSDAAHCRCEWCAQLIQQNEQLRFKRRPWWQVISSGGHHHQNGQSQKTQLVTSCTTAPAAVLARRSAPPKRACIPPGTAQLRTPPVFGITPVAQLTDTRPSNAKRPCHSTLAHSGASFRAALQVPPVRRLRPVSFLLQRGASRATHVCLQGDPTGVVQEAAVSGRKIHAFLSTAKDTAGLMAASACILCLHICPHHQLPVHRVVEQQCSKP